MIEKEKDGGPGKTEVKEESDDRFFKKENLEGDLSNDIASDFFAGRGIHVIKTEAYTHFKEWEN